MCFFVLFSFGVWCFFWFLDLVAFVLVFQGEGGSTGEAQLGDWPKASKISK